ncbi:exostosin-like 2 [Crotalus adamanteus]|uniref:Exostosin-like 2 n=1 Tax=Crotalus adamanteus TaxID=8729 RepID=A0AAW1BQI2_CROAD
MLICELSLGPRPPLVCRSKVYPKPRTLIDTGENFLCRNEVLPYLQATWKNNGYPATSLLFYIIFKVQTVNHMRNRLQVFPELETKAVLMMDDDTLVSAYDLVFAFSIWQQFPDQIVGFVPRKHIPSPAGIFSYGSFELQGPVIGNGDQYSMILVGAAFFNSAYLELFQKQPEAVHTMIDETQNCDDIAMNFLVAKHTGKPSGMFVKPVDIRNLEKESNSGYSGMWHRAEHLLQS